MVLPLEINGMADHVHVFERIQPVISISEFLGKFKWRVKYGAFTVSPSQVDRVREYIRNQEAHHSRISFEDEFKALLRSQRNRLR